jgi:hypothetical protein
VKSDVDTAAGAAFPAADDRVPVARPVKLVCHDCGKRIFVSREGFQEHYENGGHWAWHHDCRPP